MRVVGPGIRRALVLGVLAMVALASTGCLAAVLGTAAAGGAVGYAYHRGNVSREFAASFEATWVATQYAVTDEGLPIIQHEAHIDTGEISSKTAKGDNIDVSLVPASDTNSRTQVHIRVGFFGDRDLSERLLDRVAARLQQAALNPIPPAIANQPTTATPRVVPVPAANGLVPAGFQQTAPPPLASPTETAPPPLPGAGNAGKKN